MKILKLLCVALCFVLLTAVFTACDEGSNTTTTDTQATTDATTEAATQADAVISPEKWNDALQMAHFDNVTITYDVLFEGRSDAEKGEFKLAGDKAIIEGSPADEEGVAAVKEFYVKTVLAIAENYEDFEYDADKQSYVAKKTITYFMEDLAGYDANITAEDAMVKLDVDNKIGMIACHMIQESEEDGRPIRLEMDVEFTFTDYGTTVVE